MFKKFTLPLVLLMATPSVMAYSQHAYNDQNEKKNGEAYYGLGSAFVDVDLDLTIRSGSSITNYNESISGNSLIGLIVGYKFNPNLAVEFRGYGNMEEGDFYGYDVEVSKNFSVYARGMMPVDENFALYALLGYGDSTVKAIGISESESDFTYGVGMQIGNGTACKLHIEWVQMHDKTYSAIVDGDMYSLDVEASSVNLNLIFEY